MTIVDDNHITVLLPAETTVGTMKALAADIGCTVKLRKDGVFVFTPKQQPVDYEKEGVRGWTT